MSDDPNIVPLDDSRIRGVIARNAPDQPLSAKIVVRQPRVTRAQLNAKLNELANELELAKGLERGTPRLRALTDEVLHMTYHVDCPAEPPGEIVIHYSDRDVLTSVGEAYDAPTIDAELSDLRLIRLLCLCILTGDAPDSTPGNRIPLDRADTAAKLRIMAQRGVADAASGIASLQPSTRKPTPTGYAVAAASFKWAVHEVGHELTYQDAYNYVTEHNCPHYTDEQVIPSSKTWARYARGGLKVEGYQKASPRAGRPHGSSIVTLEMI